MSDEYTPTTDDIREDWSFQQTREHDWTVDIARELFDRWLADFEAKVRADQIEKDAVIAETSLPEYWVAHSVSKTIRAQLNGENDE